MSLRTEIHSAFGQIAPPTAGMPERVVETVLTEFANRRRKERFMVRLRTPLSLVAVFLLMAIVAAALIGGRLVHDWNAWHNGVPSGQNYQSELAALEALPMHLPVLNSRDDCQPGPFSPQLAHFSGPVYGSAGHMTTITEWGRYADRSLWADKKITGPILVRAVDLLNGESLVFVGPFAAGPVVGQDTVDGALVQRHTELVLDPDHPTRDFGSYWSMDTRHRYDWVFTYGVPAAATGPIGWQIDGVGFSEIFVGGC